MNISVITLMLLVSSIVLACVVVNYAIGIFESYLGKLPELENLRDTVNNLANSTETIPEKTELRP